MTHPHPRRRLLVPLTVSLAMTMTTLVPEAGAAEGDLVWVRDTAGDGFDVAADVAFDSAGNVVLVGSFKGTVDFDPGPGSVERTSSGDPANGGDIAVWKLDPQGALLWVVQAGGASEDAALGVAVDGDDDILITGIFTDTVDFDPGAGSHDLAGGASGSTFVWKLDSDGALLWVRSVATEKARAIATDSGDAAIVALDIFGTVGDFDPGAATLTLTSSGLTDVVLWKLDTDGALVWVRQAGGTATDRAEAVAVDGDDGIVVAGYFFGTSDFDPGAGLSELTSSGDRDVFVWKVLEDGSLAWARSAGGAGTDFGDGIAADADGDIVVTGGFVVAVDFDPGPGSLVLDAATGRDIFAWKLDSSGSVEWARHVGPGSTGRGRSVAIAADGGVMVTGTYIGAADFDPGPGETILANPTNYDDAFVWEMDTAGGFLRAFRVGGSYGDGGRGVTVDDAGTWAIAGFYTGSWDFDPGSGSTSLSATPSTDAFVWLLEGMLDRDGDGFADGIDLFPTVYSKCRTSQAAIIGTAGNDNPLNGTAGNDVIMGLGGADVIYGLGGDDLICAGNGADIVYGGDGKDRIYGENGPDTIYGNEKSDRLYGGDNDDVIRGGDGTRDRLYGGAGTNDLDGGSGTDDRCTLGPTFNRCEVIF